MESETQRASSERVSTDRESISRGESREGGREGGREVWEGGRERERVSRERASLEKSLEGLTHPFSLPLTHRLPHRRVSE